MTNYKINSVGNLKCFTSLNYIDVNDDDVTRDLKYLSELKNLQSIKVERGTVKGDLGSLNNLTELSYINIYGSAITGDLSSISGLSQLERLNLNKTKAARISERLISFDISVA